MPRFLPALALLIAPACERRDRCDGPVDCASDEYCSADATCEPIFSGAPWSVKVVEARTGEFHPDGAVWDPDESPPDLYVEFGLEDGDGCVTTTAIDDPAPQWDQVCDVEIAHGGLLLFNLWDSDADEGDQGDEFGTGWYFDGDTAIADLVQDWGHDVEFHDSTNTVFLVVAVEPND